MGIFIGFNGLITYNDRNKEIIKAIKENPNVEQYVVETDAPFLTPGKYRGRANPNMPKYLDIVTSKIAKELNLNPKLLHEKLNLNAFKVYNFKKM